MLLKRTDEFGNIIYSFSNIRSSVKTSLMPVRRLSEEEYRQAKKIYKKRARVRLSRLSPLECKLNRLNKLKKNNFVRRFAVQGALYGSFAREVIEDAARGFMPDNYDLHHVIPLSLGGENSLNNMVIIEKNAHAFLHKYLFDEIFKILSDPSNLERMPLDKKVYVEIPHFGYVVKPQNMRVIFTNYTDYEDERDRLAQDFEQKGSAQELKRHKAQPTFAQHIQQMRERGELPPDPTKGAQTVRLVKKAGTGRFKRLCGRER